MAPDDMLTKRDAARLAAVHERTINRWLRAGMLTRYIVGINRVRVSRTELEGWLRVRRSE